MDSPPSETSPSASTHAPVVLGRRPLFVYDGRCGFCKCWIARWRCQVGQRVYFAPYQEVADRLNPINDRSPQINYASFAAAAHLIEPDGRVSRGAEAVSRMFALAGRKRWRLWAYEHVPGFAATSEAAYRFVAGHRSFFSRITNCSGDPAADPRGLNLTRWIFLRALGIVYLLAFASLRPQLLGLIGSSGILPAKEFLESVGSRMGVERYFELPTLCWYRADDAFLQFLCIAGMVLAGLLILDVAPALTLTLLWIVYLSLTHVGQVFLQFQWDALLLETGLLAIFLAPLYLIPRPGRAATPPSLIAVWLLRWLLFRLMFLSGVVKLASQDPTWRDLTALTAHYQTQPLSNWVAWYFWQLPLWFQKLSCGVMFVIELVLPFGIFAGRIGRRIACAGFVLLQVLIIVTGNYGFFNVLTLALCILLLDDGAWPAWLRRRFGRKGLRPCPAWPAWLTAPVAAVVLLLTTMAAVHRFRMDVSWPRWTVTLHDALAPSTSFNAYGLFAAMTHERPEIIVEGSDDGRVWKPYEFRYKPGDERRAPPFVAPHMPRLDWQMWFAALGSVNHNLWFVMFEKRLLQGTPEVLDLLQSNPFPDHPPRYVRALLYDYKFTDRATRTADGSWWRRELKGTYCPPLDLNFFQRRGL